VISISKSKSKTIQYLYNVKQKNLLPKLIPMNSADKERFITTLVRLTPFFLLAILGTWLVSGNIFFWDTVQLGAKHATFFHDNNFSAWLLPDDADSGHIPAFGMYLALCWSLFGKSLAVSHFAMLPFLLGIIWQSYILIQKFVSPKYRLPALIVFLSDATLLAQSTLVSPDIPLIFLFLTGLNALLSGKKYLVLTAVLGLALVSMRGMMAAFALLLVDLIYSVTLTNLKQLFIQLIKKALIYLPALLVFMAYNLYHYRVKGWVGYHEDSPWAECFQRVGIGGVFYNAGILAWRMLDFGRVFLWIAALMIIGVHYKKIATNRKARQLFIILFLTLASLSVTFLLYKNLSGHRYLLPAMLMFSMFTIYLVTEILAGDKIKYALLTLLSIGLLSGNLWIYPRHIAQGWDASLAHLPYFGLRDKMLHYLGEQKIPIAEVASVFPNNMEIRYLDLTENRQKHPTMNLDTSVLVLYSNVFNDITDEEFIKLDRDFRIVKEAGRAGIYFRIYRKK
jgi:hypothetical protein